MIKDKEKYMSHIKDKEQILNMRKILDKIDMVEDSHTVQITDFLDPYERRLAKSILNRFNNISYLEDGGYEKAERKVIIIYPDYMEYKLNKSPVAPLSISGSIEELKHKDFLGAILGLGITREKVGDILIHEDNVQVITKEDIYDFVLFNLKKVGKNCIKVESIDRKDIKEGIENYKDKTITVPSLRLDVLISSGFNLSRNDSLSIIKNSKVKVNWQPIEKPFFEVAEEDMISVRGYGRFILFSILGKTKKDRVKVIIRIFK